MHENTASVTVTCETLEEEFGLWCPKCALPSGGRVVLAVLFDGRPDMVYDWRGCDTCEWEADA